MTFELQQRRPIQVWATTNPKREKCGSCLQPVAGIALFEEFQKRTTSYFSSDRYVCQYELPCGHARSDAALSNLTPEEIATALLMLGG